MHLLILTIFRSVFINIMSLFFVSGLMSANFIKGINYLTLLRRYGVITKLNLIN